MNKKYTPGKIVEVIKDPPGITPLDTIEGSTAPIENVKTGDFIQVAGYRFDYVTARKFLKVIEDDRL